MTASDWPEGLDRDVLLDELDRLADEDAEVRAEAGAAITQRLDAADVDWDDLLRHPDDAPLAASDDEDGDTDTRWGDPDDQDAQNAADLTGDGDAETGAAQPLPAGEEAAVIKALLARRDLAESTRDDLEAMAGDLRENGRLDAMDSRYLASLRARLDKRR